MTDSFETKPKAKKPRATKGTRKRQSRTVRKKETPENAPIFLRKTYHMIDTCDPTVATWSDDGMSFVVKDIEKFSAEILGQFFKHNNFSSFVRQLNFYGFRKVKSDPLRITDAENDIESKYWKFRHEKFQRGRPDLLTEIRKTNHNETADKSDVDILKGEIKNLKTKMATMSREMERMANLVANVMQNQHLQNKAASLHTAAQSSAEPPSKKRKYAPPPPPSPLPLTIPSNTTSSVDIEQLDDISVDLDIFVPPPKVGPTPFGGSRAASGASFTSTDEEILSSLFALDSADNVDAMKQKNTMMQDYRFPEKPSAADKSTEAGTGNDPDPVQMAKLKNALSALPKNLQQMFVDRIVAFVVDPVSFKKQVDAVSALAVAAAAEAKARVAASSADPTEVNELASAILGAWLTRYRSTAARDNYAATPAPVAPVTPPEVAVADPMRAASITLGPVLSVPEPGLTPEDSDLLLDAL